MEYLKNVVLKVCLVTHTHTQALHTRHHTHTHTQFLHVTDSNEKAGLVPIITKLLQLSPHEVKFVQDTIKGDNMCCAG